MFGDVVFFMLKYCKCIPHSRWRQLLGLEAACSAAAAPAPSAIPQHMILKRTDVALGAKIGVGSFGVSTRRVLQKQMNTYVDASVNTHNQQPCCVAGGLQS